MTVEAEGGDLVAGGVRTDAGNAELAVDSGDVSLAELTVGTVETGGVTLFGRFSGGGHVSAGTGDVTARLPSGDATDLALVGRVSREAPGEGGAYEGQNGGNG